MGGKQNRGIKRIWGNRGHEDHRTHCVERMEDITKRQRNARADYSFLYSRTPLVTNQRPSEELVCK